MKIVIIKLSTMIFAMVLIFVSTISAQKGIVKFDYEYKSNAQGKLKTERERGKNARMFFDKTVGRRSVEVQED